MTGHAEVPTDSGHYLVIDYLRVRTSNVNKVTVIRTSKYNVFKLISSEVAEQYRQQIEEKLNYTTLTEQNNGEKLWERCQTIINSVAAEVLGIMEAANKGKLFDAECQAATEDKKEGI